MKKVFVLLFLGFFFVSATGVAEAHGGGRPSKEGFFAVAGLLGLFGLFGLARSSRAADVDEVAITEEQRTRREQIRASTVLAAPAALGGSGNAGYSSNEGHADIHANLGGQEESGRYQERAAPERQSRGGREMPEVDIMGFQSAGEFLADQMTSEEFRAYGYALREIEDSRPAHSRKTHREFTVPMLYELLFKLKSVGTDEQVASWYGVIRYLEVVGGV